MALLLSVAATLPAADMPVPVDLQAALFKKILGYSRSLSSETSPTIAIVFSDERAEEASALRAALAQANLVSTLVGPESDLAVFDESDVIYLMDEKSRRGLKRRCESNGLLSITGWPELVESGKASVGLDRKPDGRPEIVVNMDSLKAENQKFSSDLLNLARLVK